MSAAGLRIVRIEVTTFRIPFRQPFATARGAVDVREGALVRLETADGAYGWGEASLLPHETGRLDVLSAALNVAAYSCLGSSVEALATEDVSTTDELSRVARAGIATAAADALARSRGVSLARLLNADASGSVAVNAVIGAGAVPQVEAAARSARESGFSTVKLKVGVAASLDEEMRRVAAARNAIGPTVKLRLDANGAWTEARAIEVLNALAVYDIEYVEQPVPADDVAGLKRVRDAVPMPIAADEAVTDVEHARRILEAGAAQVLVLKPIQLSGIWSAYRVAMAAREAGVDAVVTTSIDSGIGVAAALQLAAALGQSRAAGLATTLLLTHDLIRPHLDIVRGCMALPAGPGLGVEVDASELAACTVRRWEVKP